MTFSFILPPTQSEGEGEGEDDDSGKKLVFADFSDLFPCGSENFYFAIVLSLNLNCDTNSLITVKY
jgi:hypothetical protein